MTADRFWHLADLRVSLNVRFASKAAFHLMLLFVELKGERSAFCGYDPSLTMERRGRRDGAETVMLTLVDKDVPLPWNKGLSTSVERNRSNPRTFGPVAIG